MISSDRRRNDPNLASLARTSISDFFNECGGNVTEAPPTIPAGKVLVSFDSVCLDRAVTGLFDVDKTPIKVATTLLILEPGPIDIRIRTPNTDSSPLEFLESSKARGSAREMTATELLKLTLPDRPIDELRNYLQKTAQTCRLNGIPFGQDFHEDVRNVAASLIHYTVARYYPLIDRGRADDIKEVCELFATDGEYDRAGKVLKGRAAIQDFYTLERTLSGSHTVESISVSGLTALVTGVFSGVSIKEQAPRRLEFADKWRFNTEGFVVNRHTYLSQGHSSAE